MGRFLNSTDPPNLGGNWEEQSQTLGLYRVDGNWCDGVREE